MPRTHAKTQTNKNQQEANLTQEAGLFETSPVAVKSVTILEAQGFLSFNLKKQPKRKGHARNPLVDRFTHVLCTLEGYSFERL